MTILAWLFGFGICIWAFSTLLEKQDNPNQSVDSSVVNQKVEVRLKQNRQGHYVLSGKINEQNVVFLVDTGATDVSVPAHLADKLTLQPFGQGIASTANGNVRIAYSNIDTLQIGDIVLRDIPANINPGMKGDHILLGMSALKKLEFTQRNNELILRTL